MGICVDGLVGRLDGGAVSRRAAGGSAWTLAAIGGAALLLGLAVYLADRDPARVALLPDLRVFGERRWFGALGQWLPSFVHPFAFALFTAAALEPASRWRMWACAAWGAVNVAAEAGQHPSVGMRLADAIHAQFGAGGFADAIAGYFGRGRFDPLDLAAAVFGAIAAALTLKALQPAAGAHDAT
jgi:hypothetical protein